MLNGCLFAFMLAVLITGCGGSGDESASLQEASTTADRAFDVVARTGPVLAVRVGETATLSGDKSFSLLPATLSFRWSFSSKPDSSDAVLHNATAANPSFVVDAWGAYAVQLVVYARGISSQRAIQLVVATNPPERATGPFNHQGLSSSCANCHSDEFGAIPPKSQNHIATSNMCETCHTPLGWLVSSNVDHQEVFGNCSECHDGNVAVGKSEFHATTNAECDNCHNTTSFLTLETDGSFDHTGISRSCSGCHNGTVSRGKTPTPPHPDTISECGYCHTTASFLGAYPDHTGPDVVGPGITCDSCHGVSAAGEPGGHPVPAVDCGICHSIVSFDMGGVFNHRAVDPSVQPCESCHNETNSINAPAKSAAVPTHLATTIDCGNCHNTDGFAPAFSIDHTNPAVLAARCDSCHGINATGLHANHMNIEVTPGVFRDCGACHTPGTFTTGTYDHAGVVNGCTTCHNDTISTGKPLNHIPTNPGSQDCADCHLGTDTFTGATFDHAGIFNNCMSCHDGDISSGKPASHLPTSQDCVVCHTTTAPFKPALNFAHVGIIDNCESCHNGNPGYVAAGAIDKKPNHIPALEECVVCHIDTNTGGFASSRFLATLHPNIANGCEGCHVSQFFPASPGLVKSANHLPTIQDCDVCHTVAGFTAATSTFAHVGITGNCASCHDGSPDFVALGARGKTPAPPHPVTSSDCALCHNTTAFADAFVDHGDPAVLAVRCDSCHGVTATGKDAKPGHVTTVEDCGICHVPGGSFATAVFNHVGIVDNCASCHNGIDATGTAAKTNPAHIPITEDCSLCHTPTAFANARFEHQGIVDNCAICHDGITVRGKHNDHVPTNGDCIDCHQTTGFLPSTFDHVGIVDNCGSCHGTGFATPKKVNHVATNQDCGVCHTPNSFIPATFDHTGIVNNCGSCHGVTATPMSPDHISTSLDCHFCHTTATFVGGTWTHDSSSTGNCDSCHDAGGGATFKPQTHLNTTAQCDVCHTTNSWAPTSFSHDPQGNYPGDHRRDPGCNACHGNTISGIIPWRWPQYAPFCAACHANDFASESDHIGGKSGTVAQNKDCSGGGRGCHRVSNSGF